MEIGASVASADMHTLITPPQLPHTTGQVWQNQLVEQDGHTETPAMTFFK